MANQRIVECAMNRKDRALTRWEQQVLSRKFRALFIAHNLDYCFINRKEKG